MEVYAWLAAETVRTMGEGAFTAYRVAVVGCGVLLVALGWWGMGAGAGARVVSGAIGAVLLGYGAYLWFFLPAGLVEVYPFLFILPFLVVGYLLYSRAENKEADAAVRAQLDAERAERRAARTAQAEAATAQAESASAQAESASAPTEAGPAQAETAAVEPPDQTARP